MLNRTDDAERGSVLLLFPAAALIVVVLSAIAFDLSLVRLRQRQARTVAIDAANDAVTAALDEASWRETGVEVVDARRAHAVVSDAIMSSDIGDDVENFDVHVDAGGVLVRLVVHVEYVFAAGLPGAADGIDLEATARATLVGRTR